MLPKKHQIKNIVYTYVIKECFCYKTFTLLDEYCLDNINEYNGK